MVLSETGRLQLFWGYPRGPESGLGDSAPRRGPGLTVSRRLSLEPQRQPHRGLRAGGKLRSPAGSWRTLRQLALSDARR